MNVTMVLRQEKPEKTQVNTVHFWLGFLGLLLSIQAVLLWVDHHPMFFLGDSESYIKTAIFGVVPPERSFVYGYFIRLVAVTTKSLTSLVMIQVLLSCVTSAVTAHLLIRYFRVRPWIAFVAAILTSLEPLHLLYTRYVMTETLALTVFVFYVWVVLQYLEDPCIKWLCLAHILAVAMISIRFAFIPLVWICSLAVPILAFPAITAQARLVSQKTIGRLAIHIISSVLLLFFFTSAYKHVHGHLQHRPPAYSYDSGFFAMCYVMPILEPEDFPDVQLGSKILADSNFPVKDRRLRSENLWSEGGAVPLLQKLEPDRTRAEAIASTAALHAVIQNPLAFLQLGWQSFIDYFDLTYLRKSMEDDIGNRRFKHEFRNLIKKWFHYSLDTSSGLDLMTPTGRYFFHAGHWIQILLFVPLFWGLLVLFARDKDIRQKCSLIVIISLIFFGVAVFLVAVPEPRYLHAAAWLFYLAAALGLNHLLPVHNQDDLRIAWKQ